MSTDKVVLPRRGPGRPKGVTNAAPKDRMRLHRHRNQLARLRPFATHGIAAVVRMGPKALAAVDKIIDDPTHEAHFAAASLIAKLNVDMLREIYDRTGMSKSISVEGDGLISGDGLRKMFTEIIAEMKSDPNDGRVRAIDAPQDGTGIPPTTH